MSNARLSISQYILIAVALTIFAINVVLLNCVTDDAYISYRYLDNWLAGDGLVFNVGERVEGYTNLLWIVLIAPWVASGVSPEIVSLALSFLIALLLFVGIYKLSTELTNNRDAGLSAILFVASFPPFAHYVTAGLETILFAALIIFAFARLAAVKKPDHIVAMFLGFAVLTRPEGMLVAVVLYGIYGLLTKSAYSDRKIWYSALIFVLFPLLLTCWRLWYYGDPLPNTYYAKASGTGLWLIGNGIDYFLRYLVGQFGWLLLVFAALVFFPPFFNKFQDEKLIKTLGVVLLLYVLYVIKVGGDYLPMSRFILHMLPLFAVLSSLGLWIACRSHKGYILLLTLAIVITQNTAFYRSADHRVVDEIRILNTEWKSLAEWLKLKYPDDTVLAVNAAGAVPYLTRFKTIDMLGLNDKHIARSNVTFKVASGPVPGHFKYDGKYVCSLQPDVVVMSSGRSFTASSAEEAVMVASLNSFESDRDFLRSCGDRYKPNVTQLANGRFRVVFTKNFDYSKEATTPNNMSEGEIAFNRGIELLGRALLSEARESFLASIRANPDNPDAYTNIGYTYFDEGNFTEAISVFNYTYSRYPSYTPALYGLAIATENSGETGRAVQLWVQYLNTAADPKWRARAAERLRLLGYDQTRK